MGKIWEFFEHLDEYVYVSDPETNQLVYMNQKALKSYGFQSKEEIVGLKCYEVLQGNSAPCSICNNEQLRPGYFKEWEYYNPVVKTDFRIKDTLVEDDGRMLRMEIAIDCGHSGDRETSMDYHEMEAAMNQAIRVALRQETPNQTLEVLLELLGKTMEADRTYIFEKNDHGHDDNTYEWAARGVIPEKDNLQDLPPEVCDQWYQKFAGNQNIVTENLSEIRDTDPEMYEVLSRQNIHSLVVVPLYDDEKVIGFYGVDNPPAKYIDFASEILQIMGHFIVSSIRRRNLVRIGVVYCDVTGLERVNDEEGHSKGDQLILRACDCLRGTLKEFDLFRIGGDEFVALCRGMEEGELYREVEELRTELDREHVTMAVGAAVNTLGAVGFDHLLTEPERRMYQDKAEYYRKSGLNRRRQ